MNKEENKVYREIDVQDLLLYLLSKWKVIALVAILIAALLGAYTLLKTMHSSVEAESEYERELENYETTKAALEEAIRGNQVRLNSEYDYLQNSILMQIDTFHEPFASGTVRVSVKNSKDYSELDSIVEKYRSQVWDDEFLISLEKKYGFDARYIRQTIEFQVKKTQDDVTLLSAENEILEAEGEEAAGIKSRIISISVKGLSKEYVQGVYLDIIERLQNAEVDSRSGTGGIEILPYNVMERIDRDLAGSQNNTRKNFIELNNNTNNYNDAINALIKPSRPESGSIKAIIKRAILGFGAGLVMALFCLGVLYILDPRIRSVDEIKRMVDIRELGGIPGDRKSSKFTSRLFEEKRDQYGKLSPEDASRIIAVNIEDALKTTDDKTVVLTGTLDSDAINELKERIENNTGGIHRILSAGDLINSAETRQIVAENDNVVIVESRDESKLQDVMYEVEIIKEMEKNLVGIVLL